MTAQTIIASCALRGNPLFLDEAGKHISARSAPPPVLARRISRAADEVRFLLAHGEREAIARRLREAEGAQGAEETERLRARLTLLEAVLVEYQNRGIASWYAEGWALTRSELLGEVVAIVRDRYVTLPPTVSGYRCYRFAEVRQRPALAGSTDVLRPGKGGNAIS